MGQMCPCLSSPSTDQDQEKPKTKSQGVTTDVPSGKQKKHHRGDSQSKHPATVVGNSTPAGQSQQHRRSRCTTGDTKPGTGDEKKAQSVNKHSHGRPHHSQERRADEYASAGPRQLSRQKLQTSGKRPSRNPEKEGVLHHYEKQYYGGTDAIKPADVRKAIDEVQKEKRIKERGKKEQKSSPKHQSSPRHISRDTPPRNSTRDTPPRQSTRDTPPKQSARDPPPRHTTKDTPSRYTTRLMTPGQTTVPPDVVKVEKKMPPEVKKIVKKSQDKSPVDEPVKKQPQKVTEEKTKLREVPKHASRSRVKSSVPSYVIPVSR